MFDKIWNSLFKKKSEQEFRKDLIGGLFALLLLAVGIAFIYIIAEPWFPKWVLLALAGLDFVYIYAYGRSLVDKKYFKRLYINTYDERNKEIVKLSLVASYCVVMMVVIYHFGFAFGAELATHEPELISLSGFCSTLLGAAIIGLFGTKLLLQKFY
ncbi:hypothetical protein ACVR05_02560 [Streptococcus caprae]|uniref:DUF3278 domain-containing protein n=1 Tax=Streptococcus caprae TaxID=1640501 RepID=A0ABV8CW14_9STRE